VVELSPETQRRLEVLFQGKERAKAASVLVRQCGDNLPFLKGASEFGLERVRFAALKLSEGDLEKLREAVRLAQTDWRDLLMAADFGHDVNAHQRWIPRERPTPQ
jgi:hypothetical protein